VFCDNSLHFVDIKGIIQKIMLIGSNKGGGREGEGI
jgi:hypothetical protein